ncbi:hypothetical protein AB0C59_29840 [Streptomyces sp. NPDC048664]|uniref:hypothetical protein n=1 Tax=Streptomyces sp. NPDC048664 TaxID=3154505 RepID=UPI003438EA37
MKVAHNAHVIAAGELTDSHVGETFSYENHEGVVFHARVAFVEIRPDLVNVTLDGVVHEGNSVVLGLRPEEQLHFTGDARTERPNG